jgi:carboxypeptidase family protein
MVSRSMAFVAAAVCAFLMMLPDGAAAQSVIAGVVRDTTGAVLPGVTVEASSPALIEKVRIVDTDEAGQFRIVDLRPGVYTVTFTLAGFSTVRREGIELTTNFTASINAELRVGSLEESITVSGETPLVDVQSATQQRVLTRDMLDAIPSGRSIWALGSTLPGISLSEPDVGGSRGMQQVYMTAHGSDRRDNSVQIDGMSVNGIEGDGAIQNYFNEGMFQEMSYQTSGLTAEVQSSGVRLNMIPKDGGNAFSGSTFFSMTPGRWQTDNYTPELARAGLQSPNRLDKMHDFNPSLGGPILRDRLWFFTSFRHWGVDQLISDSFYNLDPTRRTYQPDPSRQVVDDNLIKSGMARLTFQVAQKHRFAAYLDRIVKFRGHECPSLSAEEACGVRSPKRYFTAQAKYTATPTSRLLLEAGWSENDETYSTGEAQASVGPTDIGRFDRTTQERWGSYVGGATTPNAAYYFRVPDRHTYSGSLSYVTGSHGLKTGFQLGKGGNRHQRSTNGGIDLVQEYRDRRPVSVVVHNTPQEAAEEIKYDLGLYVQDSWTLKRLTLNPGIRFEFFNTYVPAQASPPGRFVPSRSFAKIENLPNWKDSAPRFGIAYDIFGDSTTAVRAHVGKYMRAFSTVGFAAVYNPMVNETDRRNWTDLNGDDIAQDNEIGAVNTPFNISGVSNRRADPDIERPYQWEYSVGIQREVLRGVSVSANWIRRDVRRQFWTDNLLVSDEDYTVVQVRNPVDPSELIPIYNLNRAKLGLVDRIDRNSDKNRRWYNGFDVGFTARVGGGNVYGGAGIGRQVTVNCEVDDPNGRRFCDHRDLDIPYLTQFKLSGTYPLPLGVRVSGSWQGYPGVPVGTNRQDSNFDTALNRVVDPSLNVNYILDRTIIPNLTQSSVTVPLIEPGTKYLDRWNQIDVRLARKFAVRGVEMQGQFDIFNLLNSNAILNVVETFGSSLDRPTQILQGRLFAAGVQVTF